MPEGHVLEFTRVTKRFNDVTAVSDFSARVEPGVVTAFLGPNGAGKTTSLRILLGQVRPTSGTATIGGVAYADLRTPLKTIGSVLEETVYRPRRTATRQLTIAAKANGIPLSRVEEVLALVGLDGEGEGRIGSFSLGMRQRLSVAHALLGDAPNLVFDEPANGLDPEGIRWMRLLMRRLADEGRTVLVSSHVLSEVEQVADHVLVLSRGQLVLSSGIETLADPASGSVVVDAADRAALTSALGAAGLEVEVLRSGLTVRGEDAKTVGAVAASAGIALSTLVQRGPTLEDVFIDLVRGGKLEPRNAIEAAAVEEADAGAPAQAEDADATDPVEQDDAPLAIATDDASAAAAVPAAAAGAALSAEETTSGEDADDESPADETAESADASTPEFAGVDEAMAEQTEAGQHEAEGGSETAIDDAESATDEAAADEQSSENEPAQDAPAGPSFDEILFGGGAPAAEESSVFETPSAAEGEHIGAEFFAGGEDRADDADGSHDAEGAADDAVSEDAAPEDDPSTAHAEHAPSEGEAGPSEETDDPRSAAVSSMLAAAARAYYEDEPRPYPFGEGAEGDQDAATADGTDHEGHEGHEGHDHGEHHHEGEHHHG